MGGKNKRRNVCIRCGKPSYGEMCRGCRLKFREETRSPNYRGGHRLVPCLGRSASCRGLMHKDAKLCVACYRDSRKGLSLPSDVVSATRSQDHQMVMVACDTCGIEFSVVKDWSDGPSLKRGLPGDKPDYFYCNQEHFNTGGLSVTE